LPAGRSPVAGSPPQRTWPTSECGCGFPHGDTPSFPLDRKRDSLAVRALTPMRGGNKEILRELLERAPRIVILPRLETGGSHYSATSTGRSVCPPATRGSTNSLRFAWKAAASVARRRTGLYGSGRNERRIAGPLTSQAEASIRGQTTSHSPGG